MSGLTISVIVPVYNGAATLAEALDSIACQTHPPQEIIVVDDGSTDDTARVAAGFPQVRYVYQVNRGVAAARNVGLELAQGDVVAYLDADDVWSDGKLAVQMAQLAAQPEAEIVQGRLQMVAACPRVAGRLQPEPLSPPWQGTYLGAALIRRAAFARVGGFDETLAQCEDLDWFLRAREAGRLALAHPEVVLYYRRHGQNLSLRSPQANQFLLRALKKSLDRRRPPL